MPISTDENLSETLIAILAGVLDIEPDELRRQPVLAAHDWTSLISLQALAEVESRFSISMDLRTFHAARTVPEMTELVAARAAGREGSRR